MMLQLLLVLLLLGVLALLIYLLREMRDHRRLLRDLQTKIDTGAYDLFTRWETYSSLRDRLDLHQGLPYTKNWSASPDFLQLIVEYCLAAKPARVMECSSGLTTLMLARCCRMNRVGKVVSLENGEEYADKTRLHLDRYGLGDVADVQHAPLRTIELNDGSYDWYAVDQLDDQPIDMLVIDGPPGFIQKHSRYPALPMLIDRLADGCVIFLDDAARPDEKQIVERWLAEFPGLSHDYVETERGCSILRLNKLA